MQIICRGKWIQKCFSFYRLKHSIIKPQLSFKSGNQGLTIEVRMVEIETKLICIAVLALLNLLALLKNSCSRPEDPAQQGRESEKDDSMSMLQHQAALNSCQQNHTSNVGCHANKNASQADRVYQSESIENHHQGANTSEEYLQKQVSLSEFDAFQPKKETLDDLTNRRESLSRASESTKEYQTLIYREKVFCDSKAKIHDQEAANERYSEIQSLTPSPTEEQEKEQSWFYKSALIQKNMNWVYDEETKLFVRKSQEDNEVQKYGQRMDVQNSSEQTSKDTCPHFGHLEGHSGICLPKKLTKGYKKNRLISKQRKLRLEGRDFKSGETRQRSKIQKGANQPIKLKNPVFRSLKKCIEGIICSSLNQLRKQYEQNLQ